MARLQKTYVCQSCGAVAAKWSGRCEACGLWNSIVEEAPAATTASSPLAKAGGRGRRLDFSSLTGESPQPPRHVTAIGEFDRVCGGGLVVGSALLIGGDPGIGKSTLLLQVAAALARGGVGCAYISGEEALDQVRLRAERLGLSDAPVQLAAATSIRDIAASLEASGGPQVAVIDSIQTMHVDTVDSTPGTVTQVRASAHALIELAKRRGICVLLVGHVTKEGTIAGPRVLEHMVDTVLYFEGERGHQFRILRAVKNRFGATDEIGVFEMSDRGLTDVANPSALFLADRRGEVSGASVFAGVEGTRPLLVAILEKKMGLQLTGHDIFLNVAGGVRLDEPAADLGAVLAVASSFLNRPIDPHTLIAGEVGLAGEVRAIGQAEARAREGAKLGFQRFVLPETSRRQLPSIDGVELRGVQSLNDAWEVLF